MTSRTKKNRTGHELEDDQDSVKMTGAGDVTPAELASIGAHDGPSIGPAPADQAAQSVLDGNGAEQVVAALSAVDAAAAAAALKWTQTLAPLLTQLSAMLETRGSLWAMTPVEVDAMSIAWGGVLGKWVPDLSMGVELTAILATATFAIPRYLAIVESSASRPRALNPLEGQVQCELCAEVFDSDNAYQNHLCPLREPGARLLDDENP